MSDSPCGRLGLPSFVAEPESFVACDCVRVAKHSAGDGSTAQSYGDAAHYFSGKETGPPYRTK